MTINSVGRGALARLRRPFPGRDFGKCVATVGLSHPCEPLGFVEPTACGANDIFPRRDPVQEMCLQQRIPIRVTGGAPASVR
jgi:hypothetical protein